MGKVSPLLRRSAAPQKDWAEQCSAHKFNLFDLFLYHNCYLEPETGCASLTFVSWLSMCPKASEVIFARSSSGVACERSLPLAQLLMINALSFSERQANKSTTTAVMAVIFADNSMKSVVAISLVFTSLMLAVPFLPVCAEGLAMLAHRARFSASFCGAHCITHSLERRSAESFGRVAA